MDEMKKPKCLILFSGGLDSMALIHFYQMSGFLVKGLYINMESPASKYELEAILEITKHFEIEYEVLNLGQSFKNISFQGEIIGRNLLFVSAALTKYQYDFDVIALGIHFGVQYYDSKIPFLHDVNKIFSNYSNYKVQIQAPFINMRKIDIVKYIFKEKLPYGLTYSCENGNFQPCTECLTCRDLAQIYEKLKL